MPLFRNWIPYRMRVALVRVARWPSCRRRWKQSAKTRGIVSDFPVTLAEHTTSLSRGNEKDAALQRGKVENLRIASGLDPGAIRSLFSDAGLTEVLFRRFILPDARYVDSDAEAIEGGMAGLPRNLLHPSFDHSEADLHTGAGHYLFRKPMARENSTAGHSTSR